MAAQKVDFNNLHSNAMIDAAIQVAKKVKAKAVLIYVDSLDDVGAVAEKVKKVTRLILVARDEKDELRSKEHAHTILRVPDLDLTRMAQIKMATLIAFSQRLLSPGEEFVFLVGIKGQTLDTLVTMTVGKEFEIFQTVDQPKLTEHIKRVVFQQVLTIALELAQQGREGKPVGALLVVGDHKEVQKYCQQNIINPFRGYTEKERNILNDVIKETVKEFCTIDGAFVIKGNGVIVSAGTTLRPNISGEELPLALGTRHSSAAAITASTRSIAITLSESTGTVRVWRKGQMITEIERAARTGPPSPPPTVEGA
ncbi:MAG: DNA integrity scanning protein DisA nucleotide-binding domain protein [Planctomycetes bacterium]|nr:DNA integrity scanning protein DisA nucleotide-binding domain protein [Planctomycetota bacterium]